MGQLNFGKRECDRALEKVIGKHPATKECNAWYSLDGKRRFRITIPKGKSGDFGTGTKKQIVNQFRLTNAEFTDLHRCTLSAADYEKKIRQKIKDGLL